MRPPVDSGRVLRGTLVAVWALGLSLVGHAAAGGGLPSAPSLAPLSAVAVAVGCVVAGRRIGFVRALAALLLLQPLLHLVLHALGHQHAALLDPSSLTSTAAPSWHLAVPMVCGHVAAAVVGALWIAWADAWLWRALVRLGLALTLLERPSPARAAVAVTLGCLPPGLPHGRRSGHQHGSRAPPAPLRPAPA